MVMNIRDQPHPAQSRHSTKNLGLLSSQQYGFAAQLNNPNLTFSKLHSNADGHFDHPLCVASQNELKACSAEMPRIVVLNDRSSLVERVQYETEIQFMSPRFPQTQPSSNNVIRLYQAGSDEEEQAEDGLNKSMVSFGGLTKSLYDRDESDDDSLQSENANNDSHLIRRVKLSSGGNDLPDLNRPQHKKSPEQPNLNDSFSTVSHHQTKKVANLSNYVREISKEIRPEIGYDQSILPPMVAMSQERVVVDVPLEAGSVCLSQRLVTEIDYCPSEAEEVIDETVDQNEVSQATKTQAARYETSSEMDDAGGNDRNKLDQILPQQQHAEEEKDQLQLTTQQNDARVVCVTQHVSQHDSLQSHRGAVTAMSLDDPESSRMYTFNEADTDGDLHDDLENSNRGLPISVPLFWHKKIMPRQAII